MDQKVEIALKSICEKAEQIFAAVAFVDRTSEQNRQSKDNGNYNRKSFLIQVIRENPYKSTAKNLLPKHEELSRIQHLIGSRTEINEFKQLGKLDTERSKATTILLTVSNEYAAGLTILNNQKRRNNLREK